MVFPIPVKILSMGRCLPERVVPSAEVDALCGLPEGWSASRNGVKERRWADSETAAALGARAAREALQRAELTIRDIDLIINASGTPMQAIPDGGPLLQRELGREAAGIPAFTMHATCLSFLVALETCANLIKAGRYRRVLIVSSEVCSVGLNFDEPESATLIGDAAAAAILAPTPDGEPSRITGARVETYGEAASLTEIRGLGSHKHPNSADSTPQDQLFHMDGPSVLRFVAEPAGRLLEALRPGLSKGLGDIRWVVPHQASLVALRALTSFGWPMDQIAVTLDSLGNCVAASIPATLYDVIQRGKLNRGDEVLLLGSGAGISLGGVLLNY